MTERIADLPNIKPDHLDFPDLDKLAAAGDLSHPSRILMLYGSLRELSFSPVLDLRGSTHPRALWRRR